MTKRVAAMGPAKSRCEQMLRKMRPIENRCRSTCDFYCAGGDASCEVLFEELWPESEGEVD